MHYKRDFVISFRETRDFYLRLALRSWTKGFWGFGIVGALVTAVYWEFLALPGGAYLEVLAAVIMGLVVVAAAMLSMCVTTSRRVRRDFRRSGRDSYVQHTEIDGFGVRVTVDSRQAKVGFDKLMKVEETGKAFYLYLAANQAWLLPKDQMEDPASESAALRQLFSTVVESRRLKLKKS